MERTKQWKFNDSGNLSQVEADFIIAHSMGLTSLVVCADSQTAQVLDRILSDLGIDAVAIPELSQAQSQLGTRQFDALIIDCKEEKTAAELIVGARRSPLNRSTLIVAMVDSQNNVRDVFARGANFVLYKPIVPERATTSLRAARGLMRQERRRNQRIPVNAEAQIAYSNVDGAQAVLTDLSEEGIAMHSERRLPPTCKVYFQFALPGQVSTVRLSGEVMWQDSAGRVGLRFADVPQASRKVVANWLRGNVARLPESDSASSAQPRKEPPAGLGLLAVSSADRREKSRLACRLSADVFQTGSPVPNRCTLSDISSGGCYVETTAPFKAGTAVEIMVRTAELKLRVRGKVQAMHPGFGMGVAFNLTDAEEREQVRQLLACQSLTLSS